MLLSSILNNFEFFKLLSFFIIFLYWVILNIILWLKIYCLMFLFLNKVFGVFENIVFNDGFFNFIFLEIKI